MCNFPSVWWRRPSDLLSSQLSSQPPWLGSIAKWLGSCGGIIGIGTLLEIWISVRNAKNGCGQKWCIPLPRLPARKPPMQFSTSSSDILLPHHPDSGTRVTLEAMEWEHKSPSTQSLNGYLEQTLYPDFGPANWTFMWTRNKLFYQNTDRSGFCCYSS